MYTDKDYETGFYNFFQVLCHYWAEDYIHSYLNEMPKPLIHSSYNLRIKKDWQY